MKVTEKLAAVLAEMRGHYEGDQFWGHQVAEYADQVEAALADVPEPGGLRRLQEQATRIAELEAQLAKVRVWVEDGSLSDEAARLYIAAVLDERTAELPERD